MERVVGRVHLRLEQTFRQLHRVGPGPPAGFEMEHLQPVEESADPAVRVVDMPQARLQLGEAVLGQADDNLRFPFAQETFERLDHLLDAAGIVVCPPVVNEVVGAHRLVESVLPDRHLRRGRRGAARSGA